jgi:hypothetical protein
MKCLETVSVVLLRGLLKAGATSVDSNKDVSSCRIEVLVLNFCQGLSSGDNDSARAGAWFEAVSLIKLSGVEDFLLRPMVGLTLRGGEFAIFSVSISISGASRRTFAALVKVVRALAGMGAAWLPVRKGGFLGLVWVNTSSRDGRYGEEEQIRVELKVRGRAGEDKKISGEDMARK